MVEIDLATDSISGQIYSNVLGSIINLVAPMSGNIAYAVQQPDLGSLKLSEITVTDSKPPVSADRISGKDRYETAVAVSVSVSGRYSAETVYVVTGEQFPDALAAGPAANAEDAPLLLTKSRFLPAVVREEILRLKPKKVIIVGSAGAVSDSVLQEIKGMVPNTIRRGGLDRYATARAVVAGAFKSAYNVSFATGANYPDALSADAASPVLLVRPGTTRLDSATKSLLKKLEVRPATIMGSTGVVSASFQRNVTEELLMTVRFGGKDRFETNRLANKDAVRSNTRTYFASGFDFPDALTVSATIPRRQAVLYLVRPRCIPASSKLDLAGTPTSLRVTLIGGPTIVGNEVAFGKTC